MRVATVIARRNDGDGGETLERLAAGALKRPRRPAVADPRRLRAVRKSGLLDSPRDARLDRLTPVAARALNAPVALVTVVDEDRQFLKSCVGVAEPWASSREMPHVLLLLSAHSRMLRSACRARRLRGLAPKGEPAIRDIGAIAYAGIPLVTTDGHELGRLCVIDHKRRDWSADELALLREIAAAVTEVVQRVRSGSGAGRCAELTHSGGIGSSHAFRG